MSTQRPSMMVMAATAFAAVCLPLALGGCGGTTTSAAPASTAVVRATTTTTTISTTIPDLTKDQLLALARKSVVRVRNTGCGELSIGTAWLAADGQMVSNRHVVEGERFLEMSTWDGRDLAPKSARVADDADISRIAGDWRPGRGLVPLPIRTTRVVPGERIAIVGYPEGNELQAVTGVAVNYAKDPDLAPREILKLTTVVRPGNSGGPALDVRGRVVGVVYAKELATSESLVIPIADVFGAMAAGLRAEPTCE